MNSYEIKYTDQLRVSSITESKGPYFVTYKNFLGFYYKQKFNPGGVSEPERIDLYDMPSNFRQVFEARTKACINELRSIGMFRDFIDVN